MEFDMALVVPPEDVVFILKGYCYECADKKVGGIIKIFPIESAKAKSWIKTFRLRAVRIKCECKK